VTVTAPDGTAGTLHQGLTLFPQLVVTDKALHWSIKRGATLVVLAQSVPGSTLAVQARSDRGQLLPHAALKIQQAKPGQWRIVVPTTTRTTVGGYEIVLTLRGFNQLRQITLAFTELHG
jgi:hypothetical protein